MDVDAFRKITGRRAGAGMAALEEQARGKGSFELSGERQTTPARLIVTLFHLSAAASHPFSLLHLAHPNSISRTSTMLASSRTALRQAAAKPFSLRTSARAASAWSSVPQGPPVSRMPAPIASPIHVNTCSTICRMPFSVSPRPSRPTATPRRSTWVRDQAPSLLHPS
jgi:hypothetical protein